MGNMGYCRFQNTLQDLRDCNEHLWDGNLSEDERNARRLLVKLCREIADDFEDESDENED